jgi:hypothetical protein
VARGAGVDEGGKIARKVVGVAAGEKRKREGKFRCHLGLADEFAVLPDFVRDGRKRVAQFEKVEGQRDTSWSAALPLVVR